MAVRDVIAYYTVLHSMVDSDVIAISLLAEYICGDVTVNNTVIRIFDKCWSDQHCIQCI